MLKETLTLETEGGEYKIYVEYAYSVDNNACCDADGNRGCREEYVEDVTILKVVNSNGVDLKPRLKESVIDKLCEWAENEVDPGEAIQTEKEYYADLKYDEMKEENRL